MPESKVLTVPQDQVNDVINLRSAFGWQLQNNSARSFATGGTLVGAGYAPNRVGMGAAKLQLNTVHLSDLAFQRMPSPRRDRLASLEHEYDAMKIYNDRLTTKRLLGFGLGGFVGGSFLFGTVQYFIDHSGASVPAWVYIAGAAVGIPGSLGYLVWRKRQRDAHDTNAWAKRRQLVAQARATR